MRSVEYDEEADALYVRVAEYGGDVTTKKLSPGVFADYDEDGLIVGIEVLRASQKVRPGAAEGSRLMTLAEAEEKSGLSAITLRTQIKNKRLHATKKGRDWLVSWNDVAAYLRSRHAPKQESYVAAGGVRLSKF
ncbi:MAG: DUF2283 domain-containing protein [Gemmatimonadaceae bacterium]